MVSKCGRTQCAPGQLYDPTQKQCAQSSEVDCGKRPCTSEPHCPCITQLPSPQQVVFQTLCLTSHISGQNEVCDPATLPDEHRFPDYEDCAMQYNCGLGCFDHQKVNTGNYIKCNQSYSVP